MEEHIRKILRVIRHHTYRFIDFFLPEITYRTYLGLKLFYSKGTGTIDRIRFLSPKKIYEEEICNKIVTELKKNEKPVFFDIGANVGLISLFVHKKIPECNIFAFEPGIHQRSLLEMTISSNALFSSIKDFPYAISHKNGITTFHTNSNKKDVAGDGFLDTKRSSHATKEITVETITLDYFVEKFSIEKIDVIKIDIEGAELWAFAGGRKTIERFKPVIFFELQPLNLRAYPYSEIDVINFLKELGYEIFDMDNTKINQETLPKALQKDDMFIAKPIIAAK